MCAKEQPTAVDDVWGDGDSDTPEQALDREWEARHHQFYNVRIR